MYKLIFQLILIAYFQTICGRVDFIDPDENVKYDYISFTMKTNKNFDPYDSLWKVKSLFFHRYFKFSEYFFGICMLNNFKFLSISRVKIE